MVLLEAVLNDIVKAALTPTQAQVAELLLKGLPNREIAKRLGTTPDAVNSRLDRMYLRFQIEPPDGVPRIKRIILARMLLCA